jgi:hypothetical protein
MPVGPLLLLLYKEISTQIYVAFPRIFRARQKPKWRHKVSDSRESGRVYLLAFLYCYKSRQPLRYGEAHESITYVRLFSPNVRLINS